MDDELKKRMNRNGLIELILVVTAFIAGLIALAK
jgi:hypothetical protein